MVLHAWRTSVPRGIAASLIFAASLVPQVVRPAVAFSSAVDQGARAVCEIDHVLADDLAAELKLAQGPVNPDDEAGLRVRPNVGPADVAKGAEATAAQPPQPQPPSPAVLAQPPRPPAATTVLPPRMGPLER